MRATAPTTCAYRLAGVFFIVSAFLWQNVDSDDIVTQTNELIMDADYDLKILSKQVKALVERRTEDLRSIEESVRKTLFNGPEVEELRDQVRSLKEEIEVLRYGKPPTPSPASKNEKLTLKWLSNAVYEVKTEIADLQRSINTSVLLQDHERHETKMELLQSDISSLNIELEEFRLLNAKKDAEMSILRDEFNSLKNDWRSMSVINGKLRNQLKSMQLEWAHNWRALQEKQLPALPTENSTHVRHMKIFRHHIVHLETQTKYLHKENSFLKNKLSKMEEQIKTMKQTTEDSYDRINGNDIQNYISNNKIERLDQSILMVKKLNNVSEQQVINTANIANLSKQMSNFDKIHMSMLELLENVESLENKVDKGFPELRKEISKIESQGSQVIADVSLLKEDHNNVQDSMKAISFSVSKLQEVTSDQKETLQTLGDHIEVLEKSTTVQNSRLHDHILKEESSTMDLNSTKSTIHLVEELKSFESEYKSIVNKLPTDCGSVDGAKGIYLISPGDGNPILAHCDNGWTTVQKRHDGSINFNRNWNEYSNGFGSATGEHWLGNRNLHHLTKDNCTMLKINMKDIYGKYWEAYYDHFHIGDYTQGFKLTVSHYHGNASDAMDYQNMMEFSTVDNDRDISNTHCASNYEGGWWFSHCQHANLNGRYNLGLTWFDSSRNEWIAVAQSEMKVKRRDVC